MNKNKFKNMDCDDTILPDPQLLAWEKWIQIRKEETENLVKKTGREPVDFAMNILENIREDKERKTALEHAQLEKKISLRYTLWEQPERLKQQCYYDPVYEVHRTKADIGRPKIIEHIGVPKYIQKNEKGLTGVSNKKSCPQLNANYIEYRQKRENELQNKIKKIDPYRPEMDELIVIGGKPKPVIKYDYEIPKITVHDVTNVKKIKTSIYALQINKTVIYKDIPKLDYTNLIKMQNDSRHEKCSCWSYYFNTSLGKVGRAKLFLKNLGTVTLRYFWREIKKPIGFIPDNYNDQVFFFNKNENVIYPGQYQEIYLTFISYKTGLYHESWEIGFCNVNFFDALNDKLVLNLTGEIKESLENIKRRTKKLKNAINISALKIIARSLIEEVITNICSIEHQIYPYRHLFLESELFEMKNPVCFYHQTEVAKMKELYTEMVPGELWDLSIGSWRKAMIDMDFDDRMNYFGLLKQSHRELLKPWYEGEDLLEQKYRAVNILLGQFADKFDEEYLRLINIAELNTTLDQNISATSDLSLNYVDRDYLRNIFYIQIYEHFAATMEMCAAVISSLDLNRWIHFDFCRN